MKVAAIQMNSGADVAINLDRAERLVARAAGAGAGLVVLPENFSFMGHTDTERLSVAEPEGDGPAQAMLARVAAAHRVVLVGGTVPLAIPGEPRTAAASLVFDGSGRLIARYDKIHLFDVELPDGESYRESDGIAPGDSLASADTPVGRVGLSVCYDLRFPELYRALAGRGCTLFTVPSAFTAATGEAHWEVLLRARAIENLAYVIAPGQHGAHPGGRSTWGHSMIVDPWGRVLANRASGPGIVVAEMDPSRQQALRKRFPVLTHGRLAGAPDLTDAMEAAE